MDAEAEIRGMTLAEVERLIEEEAQRTQHREAEAADLDGQLREINASIGRLERSGIPVPDELREVKLSLHSRLRECREQRETLEQVERCLQELLQRIAGTRSGKRDLARADATGAGLVADASVGTETDTARAMGKRISHARR